MIDRQNLNVFFSDRRKAYFFLASVVLLIIILLVLIIPQISSIGNLLGSNPTVATLNGRILTRSELISYNCNRYGSYVSSCKTNYQGQLNNFINYEVESQYLKSHGDLPTKSEVYISNGLPGVQSTNKITLSSQLYNYTYQNLVKKNIEKLLEKNVSGTVIGSIYSWYTIGSSGPIPYGSRKNYAKALINMWHSNILKNPNYVQNIKNFLSSNQYLGFITNYSNLNFNNYQSKLTTYPNFSMFNNIINQKSHGVSAIYNYDNSYIKNIGNKFIGIYYFNIPNKTQGVYSNYNDMINSLRSKDNIVVY
ncbi:MAG: hypothetical protein ACYDAS_00035 [Patescibacteria group bacterium]